MAPDRPKRFNMMLSDDEDEMLRALAEANHTTASEYVRSFVRREHGLLVAFEDEVIAAIGSAPHNKYLDAHGIRAALAAKEIDTSPLRETLERLVRDKRIQAGGPKPNYRLPPK